MPPGKTSAEPPPYSQLMALMATPAAPLLADTSNSDVSPFKRHSSPGVFQFAWLKLLQQVKDVSDSSTGCTRFWISAPKQQWTSPPIRSTISARLSAVAAHSPTA